MKVLVLDNYDSFTYNLVHLLKELGTNLDVFRNDKIDLEQVSKYDKILLSPGPSLPKDAGIMPQLIKTYAPIKDILGVCLGHQAIGEAFGAILYNLPQVQHGVATDVIISDKTEKLFQKLPLRFKVGRYHSWVIDRSSLNGTDLQITAEDEVGFVMAITHRKYAVRGVQFHPESILTEYGKEMLANWLKA
ncbi:MAG: aminodeoxychorismate/anthranilate synthase component II [Raineya sp.]|nr:aminodeoxychorismate/anthranilate synthase component II [Raineya sp.]